MISIDTSSIRTTEMTDRSVVSTRLLGGFDLGSGLFGIRAVRPVSPMALADLPVRERNERPTKALKAVAARAQAYAFAAAGARCRKQTTQHHLMWAFRGPKPWSDPA